MRLSEVEVRDVRTFWAERRERVAKLVVERDLDYRLEQTLPAIEDCLAGLGTIAGIVGAMREFSQPETSVPSEVDINRALEATVKVTAKEWRDVADVVLDLEPELPPIRGHAAELNQAFLNLIVNAAQAVAERGPEHRGTIRIITRKIKERVEVSIEDDGPGIPPEIAERIFDPFFTTRDVGRGMGQGLAVTRSIVVDRHGGSIDFVVPPSGGARFLLRFPCLS